MKTDEFKKELQKYGVEAQVKNGKQRLSVNGQYIGTVGENEELNVKINGQFYVLIYRQYRDAVKSIIAKYALTPLEDRNDYLLKNYIVPLFESGKRTNLLCHQIGGSFSIESVGCVLRKNGSRGVSQVPKVIGEHISDFTFTGMELEEICSEVDPDLASLISKNKKYILPDYILRK